MLGVVLGVQGARRTQRGRERVRAFQDFKSAVCDGCKTFSDFHFQSFDFFAHRRARPTHGEEGTSDVQKNRSHSFHETETGSKRS